jgi:hypothetical protein
LVGVVGLDGQLPTPGAIRVEDVAVVTRPLAVELTAVVMATGVEKVGE